MSDLIVYKNLSQFQKNLKELGTGLEKELRDKLKVAGGEVADQAKAEAISQQLVGKTRKLSTQIAAMATTRQVVIRSKANRKGFKYPGIYEFGGADARGTHGMLKAIKNRSAQGERLRKAGTAKVPGYGPRAFMAPAVIKKLPEFEKQMAKAIDETARKAGFK